MIQNQDITKASVKICSRCIYDERVASISFDEKGVCNYCKQVDDLKQQYGTGEQAGEAKLQEIIAEIKRKGKDQIQKNKSLNYRDN